LNVKAMSIIKNMSYTISSNLISLIVSTLVVLIIPKLIGIEEYGYWQLYIFYSSYVGFLHFGWNDGIYLRFGGEEYKNLDKRLFYSQFIELLASQIFIGVLLWVVSIILVGDMNRGFILQMVAIAMILVNTRLMFFYILQATNRIKEFARLTILDRLVYILLIIIFLLLGIRDFKLMIIADLIGKAISFIFAIFACKDLVFNKMNTFYLTISEAIVNISVGIKLMFANIASMLIIGIVRFGIERAWDVSTFGKVSLTLSISKMVMIFINAVGIIMFPILRRTSKEKLAGIYSTLRDFLMVLLLAVLILYYPLKTVMAVWLPQYAESLLYMSLVFPMFIYEGKMALLINTYLKTLRREKVMLRINIISMFLSLVMTYVTTKIFVSLDVAILNIIVLLAIRSALAESYVAKELGIKVKKDIILELLLTLVFILTGWFINSWLTTLIFIGAYLCYLLIKRKDIVGTIQNIKLLMKA
jgi:O-antigen/teichoic acid export membrane protein